MAATMCPGTPMMKSCECFAGCVRASCSNQSGRTACMAVRYDCMQCSCHAVIKKTSALLYALGAADGC
jgi:hypothetical protein